MRRSRLLSGILARSRIWCTRRTTVSNCGSRSDDLGRTYRLPPESTSIVMGTIPLVLFFFVQFQVRRRRPYRPTKLLAHTLLPLRPDVRLIFIVFQPVIRSVPQ